MKFFFNYITFLFLFFTIFFISGCMTNESGNEQMNSFFKIIKLYKLKFFTEW